MAYLDLDLNFSKKIRGRISTEFPYQEVHDIRELKDLSAITRSIKNIILTMPGERKFDVNYGTQLFRSMFENLPLGADESFLIHKIKEAIQLYEPRIEIDTVEIISDYEQNSLTLQIIFKVKESQQIYRLPIVMQRNR